MTNYSTTHHDGLDRVLEGADVLVHSVGPTRGMRILPMVVLTGMVAAVLAVAERAIGSITEGGFAFEWLAMWVLSVAAVLLLAKSALKLARWILRSEHGIVARWKRAEAEREFMALAQYDRRILDDLRAAQARAESMMTVR